MTRFKDKMKSIIRVKRNTFTTQVKDALKSKGFYDNTSKRSDPDARKLVEQMSEDLRFKELIEELGSPTISDIAWTMVVAFFTYKGENVQEKTAPILFDSFLQNAQFLFDSWKQK